MVKKILIIDNDVEFNEACKNFLQVTGYAVAYEQRESEAIKRIEEYNPDLILLDIFMDTKESGFDIATKINANDKLRKIPIIFLTGYFMQSGLLDKEGEITKKWDNVVKILDKPVKPETLLRAIKQIIPVLAGGVH